MKITPSAIRKVEALFEPTLQNCNSISQLKKIHSHIVKFSLSQSNFLVTKMVDICDKYNDLDYGNLLFRSVTDPNVFLFSAIIRACTHHHIYSLAVTRYREMLEGGKVSPDRLTFPFVLKSCGGLPCEMLGKQVHAHVRKVGLESHLVTENALVDMYAKCENLVDAYKIFDEMPHRDVVSWNSLISGHVKLGDMTRAKSIFDEMGSKSIVSWTLMISGYTQIGCFSEALNFFHEMQIAGFEPDEISIVSVLPACAHLGALEVGKWISIYADKKGFIRKAYICNALIEMYAKCGCINDAKGLFDQMQNRDVISWSTMICGLANHGRAHEAIDLFQEMQKSSRVQPNGVTFLGVLMACAHSGFVKEGLMYFNSMQTEFSLVPKIEHYGCIVYLLGLSGCLDQALGMIRKMPIDPDSKIWCSLLSSARSYGNLEIAVVALEELLQIAPDEPGHYVLLSNLYAEVGKEEGVLMMRKFMKDQHMKKTPGGSLVEVNDTVHEFVSGDDSKPFMDDVVWILRLVQSEMKPVKTRS